MQCWRDIYRRPLLTFPNCTDTDSVGVFVTALFSTRLLLPGHIAARSYFPSRLHRRRGCRSWVSSSDPAINTPNYGSAASGIAGQSAHAPCLSSTKKHREVQLQQTLSNNCMACQLQGSSIELEQASALLPRIEFAHPPLRYSANPRNTARKLIPIACITYKELPPIRSHTTTLFLNSVVVL